MFAIAHLQFATVILGLTLPACSAMQTGSTSDGPTDDGNVSDTDGNVTNSDGATTNPDGGVTNADGPATIYDGPLPPDLSVLYTLTVAQKSTGATTNTVVKTTGTSTGIDCGATCMARYPSGTAVQLTASFGANTKFVNWTSATSGGDCDQSTNPLCTMTMTADKSVTANFIQTFDLTVHLTGTGTPTAGDAVAMPPNPDCTAASCVRPYASGSLVTLTAKPGAKRVFGGWSGSCASNPTPEQCVVNMVQVQNVTALFRPLYTVTVLKGGGGNGIATSVPSGINCGTTCATDFVEGTDLTLTSNIDSSTSSMSWSGCDSTGGYMCVVNPLVANRTLTATYVPKYKVTLKVADPVACNGVGVIASVPNGVNCGANGSGACSILVDPGTNLTLQATYDASTYAFAYGVPCANTGATCGLVVNAPTTIAFCFAHR